MKHVLIPAGLCEQNWRKLCGRYHFRDTDLPLLKEVYEEVFYNRSISIYYEIWNKEQHGLSFVGHTHFASVIITLGNEIDIRQNLYMKADRLLEAYAAECLSMELIANAYGQADQILHEESGLWCGTYQFPGTDYPLSALSDIIAVMEQKEVNYNAAYVLLPKKSVVYITGFTPDRTEWNREAQLCMSCGNKKNCIYQNSRIPLK